MGNLAVVPCAVDEASLPCSGDPDADSVPFLCLYHNITVISIYMFVFYSSRAVVVTSRQAVQNIETA